MVVLIKLIVGLVVGAIGLVIGLVGGLFGLVVGLLGGAVGLVVGGLALLLLFAPLIILLMIIF
jgi:hypothetical protein